MPKTKSTKKGYKKVSSDMVKIRSEHMGKGSMQKAHTRVGEMPTKGMM